MKWVLIHPAIALLAVLASCTSRTTSPAALSDEQFTALAKNTSEARAFLQRYPSAEVCVDDDPSVLDLGCLLGVSCRLAVDFRVTTHAPANTTQPWEGIRLRVFLDSMTGKLRSSLLQCNEKIVHGHIMYNIEHYYQTGLCP